MDLNFNKVEFLLILFRAFTEIPGNTKGLISIELDIRSALGIQKAAIFRTPRHRFSKDVTNISADDVVNKF